MMLVRYFCCCCDISGHRFYGRSYDGTLVIIVKTGSGMVNAAVTAQLLISSFPSVNLVIHYGRAGSPDENVKLGDVLIVKETANTGRWYWQNSGENAEKGVADLKFADFTVQNSDSSQCGEAENKLYKIWYQKYEVIYSLSEAEDVFWITSPEIKKPEVELEYCAKVPGVGRKCLDYRPQVVEANKGCSADIYVKNGAYSKFLLDNLGCQALDSASAGIALVSKAAGVNFVSVKGISNRAGYSVDESVDHTVLDKVSNRNAVTVVKAIVQNKVQPLLIRQI
eukprot:TRINITY_DN708_c0_g1_i2.p1 TRINITY_DN708_c0_g1~~TRINITY_DN708_c0_g1_i2.p1  ORF type:complete len:281 (+),score=26.82 TRINITY_DN708_c0_g1_i2:321-1163(+)